MKRLTAAILGPLVIVFALACQSKSNSEDQAGQPPAHQKIFVRGNPQAVLEGTKLDPQSPVDAESIGAWTGFRLITVYEIAERSDLDNPDGDITTEEDKPGPLDSLIGGSHPTLEVEPRGNGKWRLHLGEGPLQLNFARESDGSVQMRSLSVDGRKIPVQVLNWSVADDGLMFSVLFSVRHPDFGRTLTTMYFENVEGSPRQAERVDSKYSYVFGDGVKIGWFSAPDQTLKIEICTAEPIDEILNKAAGLWQQHLTGRLKIQIRRAEPPYPPFSDLGRRCVYLVDNYRADSREDKGLFGSVLSLSSGRRALMADSDMFIYRKELEKTGENLIGNALGWTLTHELGHMLGLGHKMTGPASVMSYERVGQPQAYDIEALHLLYPPR